MKKLLVLVFALVLLVSLASVSLAVATTLTDGKVEVSFKNAVAGQALEGNLSFDLTKTYSEQLSAGATIKVKPAENISLYVWKLRAADATEAPDDAVGAPQTNDGKIYDYVPADLDLASAVAFDGAGWVKFNYSPLVVTAKTSIDGGVTKDILTYAIAAGPGVQVDYTVMEGLTATVIGNTGDNDFGYIAKAAYTGNGLTIGAGYQGDGIEKGQEAIGAYGSYTVAGITAAVEYNNRMSIEATNILAKVGGTFGPLTANVAFVNQAAQTLDDDNADQDWCKYEALRFAGTKGNALKVDASFKVIDPLTLSGNFQMDLSQDKDNMSYNGTATYALSDALSVAGTYKAFGVKSAINATVTNTFAAGLVGSLSLDAEKADAEADFALSYTAKVTATL